MESTYIVVFSCVAGSILLISVLTTGVLWARLSAVDDRQEALGREVLKATPPKQLEKAMAMAEGTRDRVDNSMMDLSKFKDQVHGEMQRFYATMRRTEKVFEKQSTSASAEIESAPPDEISVERLRKSEGATPPDERESKSDLRKRARAAGLL